MNRRAWLRITLAAALSPRLHAEQFPHRARVVEIEDLTHDTKRIRFRLVDQNGFRFTPGQYVFLKSAGRVRGKVERTLQDEPPGDRPSVFLRRQFQPAAGVRPHDQARHGSAGQDVPPGVASSFVHTALKKGDEMSFSAPTGMLYLRRNTGRPVIIVAGGTGAAPFVSLLEYWFENGFERNNRIYFFFGVRAKRNLFLDERFRAWQKENKIRYFPALSNPTAEDRWQGETGLIQDVVDKHFPAAIDADAYLAGSPVMLRETVKVLNAKGIGKDRIHFDEIAVR